MHRLPVAIAVALLWLPAPPALAEGVRTVVDDLEREVRVPDRPERVVVTESQSLAVPLIELGLLPVGSQGMMFEGTTPTLRGSAVTTGVDFDNADIEFIGFLDLDLEAIAALEPDLILHSIEVEPYTGVDVDKLSPLAPVVALESFSRPLGELHARLADITGADEDEARLRARHEAQLAQLVRLADPASTSVSTFLPQDGGLYAEHTWGLLGEILREAGFAFPPIIDDIAPGGSAVFSAERLAELDADWVILTYRSDAGEVPGDAVEAMEDLLPSWCEALRACREGRTVFLPRDEATTPSYAAASALMLSLVATLGDPLNRPDD